MILISVDDHVIEPRDAFKRHMPLPFAARAPFVETHEGRDYWNVDGRRFMLAGLNAVAGRPREEYGIEPVSFDELRPATYDIRQRVDDMNANGVLGSMCFPSVMGFGGGLVHGLKDHAYALVCGRRAIWVAIGKMLLSRNRPDLWRSVQPNTFVAAPFETVYQ